MPQADVTAGLVDVGDRKFLVYPNYDAILGYNCAHYSALSVALLADEINASTNPSAQSPKPKSQPKRPVRRKR